MCHARTAVLVRHARTAVLVRHARTAVRVRHARTAVIARHSCPAVVAAVAVACVLVAAAPTAAKEGTRATLENPSALMQAAPGERIAIAWTLSTAARLPILGPLPKDGGRPEPFGASGVYVRVRGRDAAAREPVLVASTSPGRGYPRGRYVAHVVVPAGGIASLAIGLEGYQIVRGRAPVRADVFFPIDNDPFTRTAAADGRAQVDSGDGGPGPPWALLAAGCAAVAGVGSLLARRRARTARHAVT